MATAEEKRLKVRDKYRTIIGRNKYSQERRNYCYTKYKDGCYYSDCSSSVCHTYKQVGLGFGILNTVGIWNSKQLQDVPVKISNGIIQNPEVLRIGDMLLFAGNDSSRKSAGYVGHVEMVGEISGRTVQLYGHGSGNPKKHEMNAYCKYRKNTKASTPLGHRGLIRVRRFIPDDGSEGTVDTSAPATDAARLLRNGCEGADVRAMQEGLIKLGFDCGRWGADGDFGDATEIALRSFQQAFGCKVDGIYGPESAAAMEKGLKAMEKPAADPQYVQIHGGNCYLRLRPEKSSKVLAVLYADSRLPFTGQTSDNGNGWLGVEHKGQCGWVSRKYGRLVE